MTREEQIKQAAIEDCGKYANNRGYYPFVAGVKWADEHPKSPWISVEKRLPEDVFDCIVTNQSTGYTAAGFYHKGINKWMHTLEKLGEIHNVTHWFPKPKFEEES